MRRIRSLFTVLGLFALFVFIFYPNVLHAQERVSASPPNQVTLSNLDEAVARAGAARKLILDFDSSDFFPSEWAAAESLFTQAEQQRSSGTPPQAQDLAALYVRAAEAYEAMLGKTLTQYYERAAGEIVFARDAAISSGANIFAPDFLLKTDNTVVSAVENYHAEDYYAAKSSAADALNMYTAIGVGVEAFRIREEIALAVIQIIPEVLWQADDVGLDAINKWDNEDYIGARDGAETSLTMFSGLEYALWAYMLREEIIDLAAWFAPQDFAGAEDVGWEAINEWEDGDFYSALTSAENALLLYSQAAASAERQRALELRANTAVELEYIAAMDSYNMGNISLQMRWNEDALAFFEQSRFMFREAAHIALHRRRAAEAALIRADRRLAESDEIARNVEAIIQGGMQ